LTAPALRLLYGYKIIFQQAKAIMYTIIATIGWSNSNTGDFPSILYGKTLQEFNTPAVQSGVDSSESLHVMRHIKLYNLS